MESSPEDYEPARLTAALARLESWVDENNPVVAAALQPGLDAGVAAARAEAAGCRLPREILDFLEWHNGMPADTDVPLIWYHRFMSMDDALERRGTYRNPFLSLTAAVPPDWFPVFEFQGEYYFTRCQSGHDVARIWHWLNEEPETRPAFGSLTDLIETAVEWYERGAVSVVDRSTGMLEEDLPRVREIYERHNPGYRFPYRVPDSG